MSITKTITLYEFSELSDKAKEVAREWWRNCEGQDFGGHNELSDIYDTPAKLLGIEFRQHDVRLMSGKTRSEPNVWWGLHTQGSGASFDGTYSYVKGSVKAVKKEFPQDTELHRIATELSKLQKQFGYKLTAKVSTSGREVHEYSISVEAYNHTGDELPFGEYTPVTLLDLMRSFARWIYKRIDADWTYRMSDENVDDSIEANEYTFTVNGKRED